MNAASSVRLELSWPNKDKFLLTPRSPEGTPVWVSRSHPAAVEVRLTDPPSGFGLTGDGSSETGNLVFQGDSLDVLRIMAEHPDYRRQYRGHVKCVYIDPPFNTGQVFTHYDDWMEHSTWLSFMRDRLLLIRDLLSSDGIVWIHLDSAEVHRMRCLMDEVLGASSFLNQVTWKRTQGKSSARRGMGTMCDTILVYGRNEKAKLYPLLLPLTEKHLAAKYRFEDERGRYMLDNLTAPGARTGDSGQAWRGRPPSGRDRHWAAPPVPGVTDGTAAGLPTRERLDLLDSAGYIHWPPGDRSVPMFKRYLRADSGTAVGDLWDDIPRVANTSRERRGYDTQKPEALVERVLAMSTRPDDLVLDVFGGSGTTAAVAHKMKRRWVTADISADSVDNFIIPRLSSVVDGSDNAGITESCGWTGGGGFSRVDVRGSMYEVLGDDIVLLRDDTVNGTFAKGSAAQLDFDFIPNIEPFCGRRGRMLLAVFDGAVGTEEVAYVLSHLQPDERVTIVAKVILRGSESLLSNSSYGSRIFKAPRDLLRTGSRRNIRRESLRT